MGAQTVELEQEAEEREWVISVQQEVSEDDPVEPEPGDEPLDEAALERLRQRFEQARPRLASAPTKEPARLVLTDLEPGPRRVLVALGAESPSGFVHRCQGGCSRVVRERGDWCSRCAAESRRTATMLALRAAIEAVNPEGSRAWCRPGDPLFEAAMDGTPDKPGIRRRYKALPRAQRDQIADDAVFRAEWTHERGSLALIGP